MSFGEPLFRPPITPPPPPSQQLEDYQPPYRPRRRRRKPRPNRWWITALFVLAGAVLGYVIAREIAPLFGGWLP